MKKGFASEEYQNESEFEEENDELLKESTYNEELN
jgi:hypothetical protein